LKSLLGFQAVVSRGGKIEESNAIVVLLIVLVLIAHHQSVIFTELVIESRAKIHAHPWISDRVAEVYNVEIGIQNCCAHNGKVIDIPALESEEK